MASVNGILSPPPPHGPADDALTHSAKRKRDDSIEGHDQRNGSVDPKGTETADSPNESAQASIRDLIDVLKTYDTIPSILSRTLPQRDSAEPQAKRQKAEDGAELQSCILARADSNAYKTLDDVLRDVDTAVSDITEKMQLPNGAARNQFIPIAASQSELSLKISGFKKRAHELVEREKTSNNQSSDNKMNGSSNKAAYKANGNSGTNTFTQINAGSGENKMVLTLYGNAPGPKQLFSSFQIPTKVDGENKDVKQYIREAGLPTGINTTQIVPIQSSSLVEESKQITMGEVFPTPANVPAMQPPKPSKITTTRALNVGWYQPVAADPFPKGAVYSKAQISCGQWLDYSNAGPPQTSKKRQRDRTLSLGGIKATQADGEAAEQESAKLEALFRSAYSSFAPTKDDSAAVAPTGLLEKIWWQTSGEKGFQRVVENALNLEAASTIKDEGKEATTDDEELKKFEEMVENWDEEAIDPSLVPLDVSAEKPVKDREAEEILEEISELLETLNSYQRIRLMTLSSKPAGSLSASDASSLGPSTKPSDPEQATYEVLKAQLTLMIKMLPPYFVSKLDQDRLADLAISTKIEIQTDSYRGVMEEDEAATRARAAAASSTAPRPVPATVQHRSSSSALYGSQYSTARPAAPVAHQYYGNQQTPIRPPQPQMQRPPATAPAPYPAQRAAAAAPYRPTSYGNTPSYPHQAPRPAQPQYPPSNPPQYLQTPGAQNYMRTPSQGYPNTPHNVPQQSMNGRYPTQPTYPHQQQPPAQNGIDYRYGTTPAPMPRQVSPQKPMYSPQPTAAQPRPSYSTPTASMPQDRRQYFQTPTMNGATPQPTQPQYNPHQPTQMTNYSTFMTQEQQSSMMERQRAQLAAQQAAAQQQARSQAQAGLGSPSKNQVNGTNAVAAGL
ncbi:hypothetical protein B0J14DRAFT_535867 [Halenospora varia]|nr:hypothetical protein B0J14DRAFT_535867 [Halenospora varia]